MRKAIKQFFQNFKKDQRGLTLVELLAVIVILAIVGLIAFIAIGNVIDNSRQDSHVANAQQIISAAELFEASGGTVPLEGDTDQVDIGELDTLPNDIADPWGKDGDTSYLGKFTLTYQGEGNFTITSNHAKCIFEKEKTKSDLAREGRDACKDD